MTKHQIVIRRSIEDVFAVLTDVTLTARWFPVHVDERWVTPPPRGVGSVRRASVRVLGRSTENDAVVTAYEPPRLAALRGLSSTAPFEVTLRFTPMDGGTRVDVNTEMPMHGLLRPVGALFSWWYGGQWDRGLVTLKRMMDAGELNPGPG